MFLLWVPQGTDAVEHQSDRTQNTAFECWRFSLKNTHCFLVPCSPARNMFPAPQVMVRRLDQLPAPQSLWVSGDVALVPPWRSTGSTRSQGAETQGMVATTDRWVKSTTLRTEHGKVQRREGRELEVTDRGRGG